MVPCVGYMISKKTNTWYHIYVEYGIWHSSLLPDEKKAWPYFYTSTIQAPWALLSAGVRKLENKKDSAIHTILDAPPSDHAIGALKTVGICC